MTQSFYATNFELSKIVNHVFGGVTTSASYDPVPIWYLGLSQTAIGDDGTNITEPDESTGYGRVAIPNNKTYWTTACPTTGSLSSASMTSFAITDLDVGTIAGAFLATGSGLYSTVTAGCVCYYYNFIEAFTLPADTIIHFDAGKIIVEIT